MPDHSRRDVWLRFKSGSLAFALFSLPILVAVGTFLAHEPTAIAAGKVSITAHATPGAQDCPNATTLAQSLQRMSAGPSDSPGATNANELAVQVAFDKSGAGYHAEVRAWGSRSGIRVLDDAGPNCGAIAEAVVVAIALLRDESEPSIQPSRTVPSAAIAPPPPIVKSTSQPQSHLYTSVGIELANGLLPKTSIGPSIALGVTVRERATLQLTGWWLPMQTFGYSDGRIDISLAALSPEGCVRLIGDEDSVRLNGCVSGHFGILRGTGHDYRADRTVRPFWGAIGAGPLVVGSLVGPIRWQIHGNLLIPLTRERLTVDTENGAGIGYEPKRVAVMIGAGFSLYFARDDARLSALAQVRPIL